MPHVPEIDSDYLDKYLCGDHLKEFVRKSCRELSRHDFDAIAFRGMSGALLAPPVAAELGKPLIMVRKGADDTHSACRVEGDTAAKTYIIIDDFVSSGATVNAIKSAVSEFAPNAKCVGVWTASIGWSSRFPMPTPVRSFITPLIPRSLAWRTLFQRPN